MRIQSLFTVPEGEKVTEKHLRRVLISSVCSILLCMTCLVSATWAWFYVDIQNKGNVIQIGTPSVVVKVGETEYAANTAGTATLTGENANVTITHANKPDDMNKKCPLYVTLTITNGDQTVTGYTVLNSGNGYKTLFSIVNETGASYKLSWAASWGTVAETLGDELILPKPESTTPEPETVEEDKSKEEPENNPDSAAKPRSKEPNLPVIPPTPLRKPPTPHPKILIPLPNLPNLLRNRTTPILLNEATMAPTTLWSGCFVTKEIRMARVKKNPIKPNQAFGWWTVLGPAEPDHRGEANPVEIKVSREGGHELVITFLPELGEEGA